MSTSARTGQEHADEHGQADAQAHEQHALAERARERERASSIRKRICILQLNHALCKNRLRRVKSAKLQKPQKPQYCVRPHTFAAPSSHRLITERPPPQERSICKCTLVHFNCIACIKYMELQRPPHSPGTRTCRDPVAAQTLSAASTCSSRACAVSQSARRSYRAVRPRIIYASPGGVSKKFDSVAMDIKYKH